MHNGNSKVEALVTEFVTGLNDIVDRGAKTILKALSPARPFLNLRAATPSRLPDKLRTVDGVYVTAGDRILGGKRTAHGKPYKRAPYICLVMGCENVGAPIYGMVCVKHKNTSPRTKDALRRARKDFHRG